MKYAFLVFDGFSNMVLASAIEPLRAARDISGPGSFSWSVLSLTGAPVTSSSGLVLNCEGRLHGTERLDALFVIAGYGAQRLASPAVVKALQLAARRSPVMAGLDCGAWLLAEAGLLRGRRATIHWQDVDRLNEAHLDITVTAGSYVIDGNRMTAGDAGTVISLMLKLIGERGGGALAHDVSTLFAFGGATASRLPAIQEPKQRAAPLMRAVAEMRANLEQPLELPEIAQAAAVSPRTLARLFGRAFNVTPGQYYQQLRLSAARTLTEETPLGGSEIAARTGFSSSATLSRAFSNHFGMTIRDARKARR